MITDIDTFKQRMINENLDVNDYINQLNNNEYRKLSDELYRDIEDEGWLEQLEDFYNRKLNKNDFSFTTLNLTPKDKNGLIEFDGDVIEKFNDFDIKLKSMSEYPFNKLDLIDYDNGTVYIIRLDMELKKFKTTLQEFLNEQKQILLAPNGKPSNLPKNLYEYVRSDEFKKWFGDWENTNNSSKIIDENDEPMLVFHGTKVKFNDFDEDKQKIGWLGKGFYFTNNKNATKEYGKSVMKIFLNIRKPFIVNGESPNDVYYEIKEKYGNFVESDISIILKQKGYDGVIFNHWDKGNMISCFSSNQIKIIS